MPLFLLGWFGQENISGLNETRPDYGRLTAEHIAFSQCPKFLEDVRAETRWGRDENLTRCGDQILDSFESFKNLTEQRWLWRVIRHPQVLWDFQRTMSQPTAAHARLLEIDDRREEFLDLFNGTQYLERPDFAPVYFRDFQTSKDERQRRMAEIPPSWRGLERHLSHEAIEAKRDVATSAATCQLGTSATSLR